MCYKAIVSVIVWGWEKRGEAGYFSSIGTRSEACHGCEEWGIQEQVGCAVGTWPPFSVPQLSTPGGSSSGGRFARRRAPLRNDSCLQHNKAGTKELCYTFLKVSLQRSCVISRITNLDQDDYGLLLLYDTC